MTTSGTSTFTYTRDQIIRAAGRKIGAYAAGEVPDAQTITDFADALNSMVKRWDAKGIHVWTESEGIIFMQPNQVQYALGPGTTDHVAMPASGSLTQNYYVSTTMTSGAALGATSISVTSTNQISNGDQIGVQLASGSVFWTTVNGAPSGTTVVLTVGLSGAVNAGALVFDYTTPILRPLRVPFARRYNYLSQIDVPLITMSRLDYRNQPNKLANGPTNQYFYDPQLNTGQFFVWPVPTSTQDAIKFTWYRPIQDFNTAGNTPDLPQEWIDTLIFNLAVVMAPEYDCPPQRYQMLVTQAAQYLDDVTGWDREPESTYFGVNFDQRS
jgi:hypothetical protein